MTARQLAEELEIHIRIRLNELQLYTQALYYLLTFGWKIRILEPGELKACMVDITSELLNYYQS
ncbi:hypothetical protein J2TS4_20490 [Paenibacillus sp. J2TS4]|nr:WYL domain-containing protein [Paenibacillus sp. J2TS4]GIP32839.1 hypothetical protein J2TS4_20490 [Paenibacillus sp. J2TS4]